MSPGSASNEPSGGGGEECVCARSDDEFELFGDRFNGADSHSFLNSMAMTH